MLEYLKSKNPDYPIYSVRDAEFKKYGRVLEVGMAEIIETAHEIPMPEKGSTYSPSVASLENTENGGVLREALYGGCDAQVGICLGYNTRLDALEYHNSSELNVACTDMVLFLGLRYEMEGDTVSTDTIKAFYVKKGETIEMFATTLHYCPCQTSDNGFVCIVVLPKDTNTDLETSSKDKLLVQKNKWLLSHTENTKLVKNGVFPGVQGVNFKLEY